MRACSFADVHCRCALQTRALWLDRAALESDRVSASLHHWINLTFGYQLAGDAAVAAKNVPMAPATNHVLHPGGSRVQLFDAPHPARNQEQEDNSTGDHALVRSDWLEHHRPADLHYAMTQWLQVQGNGTLPRELAFKPEEETSSSTLQACVEADLAAAGRIAVQICLRKRLHADPDDTAIWQDQASLVRVSVEPRPEKCASLAMLHTFQASHVACVAGQEDATVLARFRADLLSHTSSDGWHCCLACR